MTKISEKEEKKRQLPIFRVNVYGKLGLKGCVAAAGGGLNGPITWRWVNPVGSPFL